MKEIQENPDAAIVLGGILLGDTLRLGDWLSQIGEGKHLMAYSDSYNWEAVEIFREDTTVPIFWNLRFVDYKRRSFDWNDFKNFVKHLKSLEKITDFLNLYETFYPTLDDLHNPLEPINYTIPDFQIYLPDHYIAVQGSTHFNFKNLPSLFKVHYPLPVVNLGSKADLQRIPGSQIENGRNLREVGYIIAKADLVVGVDSWVAQFSAQIGVSSIKCHFGDWEWSSRGVKELGGADLFQPNVLQLEQTIKEALMIIEGGSKDISCLSCR